MSYCRTAYNNNNNNKNPRSNLSFKDRIAKLYHMKIKHYKDFRNKKVDLYVLK